MDMDKDTVTYRPNQRHDHGLFKTWVVMAGNIIRARELIWQLFKRDFLATYKKSFIGITWIFIGPLAGIVQWIFLQKTGMLNPGDVGIPYPAYVLIGTSMWSLFLEVFKSSSLTLVAGKSLIMQVNYPHEALLFKQIAERIATFMISLVFNVGILMYFQVTPSWNIVFLPLVILPLFLFAAAFGLVASMAEVVAVDISRILNYGLGLLLWVTPVIYSDKIDNALLQTVIKYNPLTYLVCSARDIVLYGRLYDPVGFFICSFLSVVLFLLAWRLFYVSENKIIERMI